MPPDVIRFLYFEINPETNEVSLYYTVKDGRKYKLANHVYPNFAALKEDHLNTRGTILEATIKQLHLFIDSSKKDPELAKQIPYYEEQLNIISQL